MTLPKRSLQFLRELRKHNDRDWFNARKEHYHAAREPVVQLADEVLAGLRRTDVIETPDGKSAMYRIYRDVRFSKDKTPYNVHWSALFKRATAARRGSYYLRIEPGGKSLAGGGFWGPNSSDMKLIRSHIAAEPDRFRKVLRAAKFREMFGELKGEKVKSAPRGWPKDHPDIDLLRFKQFFAGRSFTDKEVLQPDFASEVVRTYTALLPFFDYMSEILTTDLNGVSLLDD